MVSKRHIAQRKSPRYWGLSVPSNIQQTDLNSGDKSHSPPEDNTTPSRSFSPDIVEGTEALKQYARLNQSSVTLREKETQMDHHAISEDRDAITLRNRKESKLLRLPAEIRGQIWDLAFGHRTVHPRAVRGNVVWQPQRRRLQLSKWGVSYDPCRERLTDSEIYDLSLLNPNADHWHHDMRPDLGAPGWHDCDTHIKPRKFHYLVLPISKQIWEEASSCAWKTVTFAFTNSGDFQHFVHFSGSRLDQIRQVCLITPGMDFFGGHELSEKSKFERGWERALRSGVLDRFTSLVGLHLVVRSFWGTSRWGVTTVENLEFPPDECLYLPDIIGAFQRLRLRPECTTVLVTNDRCDEAYGYQDFTVPRRRKMAQNIRDFILEPTPSCDWSGPGQMMRKNQ